jgi:hypothetical protein
VKSVFFGSSTQVVNSGNGLVLMCKNLRRRKVARFREIKKPPC